MCFGGSIAPAPTPAPAPPAPAPLAQAVTPLYGQLNETQGQSGYDANGQPRLVRDPSLKTNGSVPGVGGASAGSAGISTI